MTILAAPFKYLAAGHLIFVGIVFLIALFFIFGWKNPSEKAKKITRYPLAASLLFWEGGWHLWNAYWGQWTLQTMVAAAHLQRDGLVEHRDAADQELPHL